jgi:hypothetical protein
LSVVAIGWLALGAGCLICGAAGLHWLRRRFGWWAALIPLVLVWLAVFLLPAFEGYHLGCSLLSGDVRCWTHWGLLWGKGAH